MRALGVPSGVAVARAASHRERQGARPEQGCGGAGRAPQWVTSQDQVRRQQQQSDMVHMNGDVQQAARAPGSCAERAEPGLGAGDLRFRRPSIVFVIRAPRGAYRAAKLGRTRAGIGTQRADPPPLRPGIAMTTAAHRPVAGIGVMGFALHQQATHDLSPTL